MGDASRVGAGERIPRRKTIRSSYAQVTEDPREVTLRKYQEEITHLKTLLEQKKHALQEQEQKEKRKSAKGTKPVVTLDEEISCLLEEQKMLEQMQQHRDELRALLEPVGINASGTFKDIMDELESRKSALVNDEKTVKQENELLLDQLQQATDAMIKSKRQCKDLFHRVMTLEEKLQHSQLIDEELRAKRKELEEQHLREESFRKALELKKLTATDLKEGLTKLQEEIEDKTGKVNKLIEKLDSHKEQMQRLTHTHLERMDQMQTLRGDLTRELKLKKMIVDNFIPRKVLKKIEARIRYDENADKYILAPRPDTSFEQPPVNRKLVNPYLNLTRYTNLSKVNNVYYSNENLLAVEPEQPAPKSQEFVLEEEDPYIENLIAETMRELTKELVIVCDHRKTNNKMK